MRRCAPNPRSSPDRAAHGLCGNESVDRVCPGPELEPRSRPARHRGPELIPNNPLLDAGPLIFAGTNYAFLHGIPLVTLDKGNYYLLTDQQENATLIFGRMSGITLDLADSTLFFRGPFLPNGIQLYQCSNFTLKNFKTDFINPPYTHVQLTSVDPVARTIGYATLPGWPDPASFNGVTAPFGENGRWLAVFRNGAIVPGTTRSLVSPPITANTLTLTQDFTPWTQASTLATLQPGDTIVVTVRGGGRRSWSGRATA